MDRRWASAPFDHVSSTGAIGIGDASANLHAILYETFGGPLDLRKAPDPEPPHDGVVIRVKATGICRRDWHAWRGHDPRADQRRGAGFARRLGKPGDLPELDHVCAQGRSARAAGLKKEVENVLAD